MTKAEVTMKLQKKLRSRGSAALLAITAALPLIGVAGTLLMVTVRQRDQVEAAAIVAAARDAAASGAQDAMAKLALDPNYTGTYDLTVGASLAHVVVTAWSTDGVDNDGNGKVDDLAEADYISVSSEGRVNVAYDRQGNEMDTAAMSQTKDAGSVVSEVRTPGLTYTSWARRSEFRRSCALGRWPRRHPRRRWPRVPSCRRVSSTPRRTRVTPTIRSGS